MREKSVTIPWVLLHEIREALDWVVKEVKPEPGDEVDHEIAATFKYLAEECKRIEEKALE